MCRLSVNLGKGRARKGSTRSLMIEWGIWLRSGTSKLQITFWNIFSKWWGPRIFTRLHEKLWPSPDFKFHHLFYSCLSYMGSPIIPWPCWELPRLWAFVILSHHLDDALLCHPHLENPLHQAPNDHRNKILPTITVLMLSVTFPFSRCSQSTLLCETPRPYPPASELLEGLEPITVLAKFRSSVNGPRGNGLMSSCIGESIGETVN